MNSTLTIFRRELASYFATPLAYVFIVIFLVLAGALAFHPWLYLVLIPALAMRLWAEERKSGTIELFLTLPISISSAVLGKFLAAWAFAGIALLLTFPFWLTVNYLGSPDNGVIFASYLGSFLMAGGFLAIGACISALTKNQVIAFVVTAAVCFLFTVSGSGVVLEYVRGWAPESLVATIASFSFLTHFTSIIKGVIDLRDAVFFASVIGVFLMANVILVELKKAD
jgi:ABC-2 type transport system permease protein